MNVFEKLVELAVSYKRVRDMPKESQWEAYRKTGNEIHEVGHYQYINGRGYTEDMQVKPFIDGNAVHLVVITIDAGSSQPDRMECYISRTISGDWDWRLEGPLNDFLMSEYRPQKKTQGTDLNRIACDVVASALDNLELSDDVHHTDIPEELKKELLTKAYKKLDLISSLLSPSTEAKQ